MTSLMTKKVVVAEPRHRKNHSWRPERWLIDSLACTIRDHNGRSTNIIW